MGKEKNTVVIIRAVIIILGLILLAGVGVGLNYFLKNENPERIVYSGRTYTLSAKQLDKGNLTDVDKELMQKTHATGTFVKGMEVYRLGYSDLASTVIHLKKKDGSFVTYELSGGP